MSRNLIAPLQGLRAIAAISVVIGHAQSTAGWPGEWTAPSLGVALFFVISGYLMSHLYLDRVPTAANIRTYVLARFARVYPLFALVIIASVLFLLFTDTVHSHFFRLGWDDLLPHLLLFGSGMTVWTISVEFQFYALFVLLWILAYWLPVRRKPVVFLVAGLTVCGFGLLFGFPEGRIDLFRYAHLFLLGAAIPLVAATPNAEEQGTDFLLGVLLTFYVAAFFLLSRFYDQEAVFADPVIWAMCAAFVWAAIRTKGRFFGRLLGSRVMVWLGDLSFGIYLLHRPVMVIWSWTGIQVTGVPLLFIFIGATILAAWGAHVLIEVPARRYIRQIGSAPVSSLAR